MFGLGMPELIAIVVIALLIFGPGKLPQVGSSLGKAIRDFKKSMSDSDHQLDENKAERIKNDQSDIV